MNGPQRSTSGTKQKVRWLTPALMLVVASSAILATACNLAEVEIPLGDPVVVVHAVMRPDHPLSSYGCQFVVLESSFIGTIDFPYTIDGAIPIGGSPPLALEEATVLLRNLDFDDENCPDTTALSEVPGDFRLPDLEGVYWTRPFCPGMRAGDRIELTVITPEGETISGVTRLPGMAGAYLAVSDDSLSFGTDSVTTVNRDRDTVRVHVDPVAGRLLQLDMFRVGELDMFLAEDRIPTAQILVDTVSVALPGDLADVFARGEGDDLMRAGREYVLTVSLTDTNYYDFTRSRSNDYTGRGFINHLSGGVGVFGSLVSTSTRLHVTGDFDDPRDGEYHIQGSVQGVDVDATLTAYVHRTTDSTEVSAFLDGDWLQERSGVWEPWQVENRSIDGFWIGDRLTLIVYQKRIAIKDSMMRLLLRGIREPGASFGVGVADSVAFRAVTLGSVTAVQR